MDGASSLSVDYDIQPEDAKLRKPDQAVAYFGQKPSHTH